MRGPCSPIAGLSWEEACAAPHRNQSAIHNRQCEPDSPPGPFTVDRRVDPASRCAATAVVDASIGRSHQLVRGLSAIGQLGATRVPRESDMAQLGYSPLPPYGRTLKRCSTIRGAWERVMNRLTRLASSWLASLTIAVAGGQRSLVAGEIPAANPGGARILDGQAGTPRPGTMQTRSSAGSWRASLP
jgi:hypothetical protein